ncbi:GNAT family N-acyltransferase [Stigmatella aurantiaca]|uniref:NUDIX hydrolase n=2 Tax=Stigmatella aurantiaca (strain DW4/3-1) TaxID=378806 RepID=E3FKI2_STIAD|nr:GNAT family N-acyltransferase [Stigmatella aurantiaca]ADO67955.1 NUDIX hydrolase [Stigmatella aurantiaca DW4/3-1]
MDPSIKPRMRIVCGEVRQDGRYLILQRRADGTLPLQWQFPGGRVRPGESDHEALYRSFQERLGCRPQIVGEPLLQVTHEYADYDLTLVLYRCDLGGQEYRADRVQALAWISKEEFDGYELLAADRRTAELLSMRDVTTNQLSLDSVLDPNTESALVVPIEPASDAQEPHGRQFIVKVASTREEIRALQALRFQVFYDEMHAKADPTLARLKLDMDIWDTVAEHLIVLQRLPDQKDRAMVVGTLRLVRRERLLPGLSFYTAQSFDLSPLLASFDRVVEVGRFCVARHLRGGRVILMLWNQLTDFVNTHETQALFGCGSFHGTDPQEHQAVFAELYRTRLVPEQFRPRVTVPNHVALEQFAASTEGPPAKSELPPLIRSYLRLGAQVSDAAIIDEQFNTVYVCIVLILDAERMSQQQTSLAKGWAPLKEKVRETT